MQSGGGITHDLLVAWLGVMALTTSPWKGEFALFPFPCWAWPQGFMGTKKMGSIWAERESPALAVTAKGQGQLCSFRAFEPLCAP